MWHNHPFQSSNQIVCIIPLNNKIQLRKFKEPIGFIQQFVNLAASHLANTKELCRAAEKGNFYRQKGAGNGNF